MSPYCHWLLLLPSLHTHVLCSDPCGKMKYVDGEESGDVLLRVDKEGVAEISWVFGSSSSHIATTKPHESVQIKTRQYKDRLLNGTNGSLNITKLTKADQGEFVANVRLVTEEECNQNYNLTVFSRLSDDDVKIHHNITQHGTCDVTLTCTVDKTDASVAWSNSVAGIVGETPTVQVTEPYTNSSWTCTASNPKASVSRTIVPLDICQNENTWKITCAVVIALSLLAAAAIIRCVWKKHETICTRIQWKRKGRLTSESDDPQQVGIYCEIDRLKEVSGKTETSTRTGTPKIETVHMTHLSVKSAYRGRDLLQSESMYCD